MKLGISSYDTVTSTGLGAAGADSLLIQLGNEGGGGAVMIAKQNKRNVKVQGSRGPGDSISIVVRLQLNWLLEWLKLASVELALAMMCS